MVEVPRRRISWPELHPHLDGGFPDVDELADGVVCGSSDPADLVILCSFGSGDLGFPRSVGLASGPADRLGFLFLRLRLLLSVVFSGAERKPRGFALEIKIGLWLRQRSSVVAAEGWWVCRWMIWHGDVRCWIWTKGWPGKVRSSLKVLLLVAGDYWLQFWFFPVQLLWCVGRSVVFVGDLLFVSGPVLRLACSVSVLVLVIFVILLC